MLKNPSNSVAIIAFLMVACATSVAQASSEQALSTKASEAGKEQATDRTREFVFLHGDNGPSSVDYDDTAGVVLVKAKFHGSDVWALVDTGSDATVVDTSLAHENGIPVKNLDANAISPSGEKVQLSMAGKTALEVPSQFSIDGSFLALNLSSLSKQLNRRIGVIIGMDVMSNVTMVLNGRSKKIMFVGSGTVSPKSNKFVEVILRQNLFEGNVKGRPAKIGIDLGSAGNGFIRRSYCDQVYEKCPAVSMGTALDVSGAGRKAEAVRNVELSMLGGSGMVDLLVLERERPGADVLIGYPFFKDAYTIFDYKNNSIKILHR